MRKNRLLFSAAAAYTVLLIFIAAFFVLRGGPNYLTYRDDIKAAAEQDNSNTAVDSGTKNNTGDDSKQTSGNAGDKPASGDNHNQGAGGNVSTGEAGNGSTQKPTNSGSYENVQFTRQIKVGVTGDDVKRIQYVLSQKKLYSGAITGNFDEKTKTAVISFQKANNLIEDGVVGSSTWGLLIK